MPISSLEVMRGSILCYEGKVQKVKTVGEYIMFEGWREWVGPSLINGEPLSETWLERLGFEYDQHTYSRGRVWLAPGDASYDVFLHGLHTGPTTHIQYIHQLQILYFSITGEHLKIPKLQ